MNAWIDDEFATLDLHDLRLDRRARRILDRLASKPSLSIPAACDGHEAEREAAYRFFDNDNVDDYEILRAHRQATRQRLAAFPVVLLAQDTTAFDFSRPNEVVVDAGPLTYASRIGFPTRVPETDGRVGRPHGAKGGGPTGTQASVDRPATHDRFRTRLAFVRPRSPLWPEAENGGAPVA
jgi:hypothetical protein